LFHRRSRSRRRHSSLSSLSHSRPRCRSSTGVQCSTTFSRATGSQRHSEKQPCSAKRSSRNRLHERSMATVAFDSRR
jgi:hypothetical protein